MQSKKYANIEGSDLANGTLAVFFFHREWIMRYEKLLQGIAIPQTGIAAPTLTAIQDFEAKKRKDSCIFLRYSSIMRILTFHAFALPAGVDPGAMDTT